MLDSVMRGAVRRMASTDSYAELGRAVWVGVFTPTEAVRILRAAKCIASLKGLAHEVCPLCGWVDAVGTEYCPSCSTRMVERSEV